MRNPSYQLTLDFIFFFTALPWRRAAAPVRITMSNIVVVGSLNMDLVIRTPRLPVAGETILGHNFTTAPGGKGGNQAVAAAKLGAPVKIIGRTGTDDFGRILRAHLNAVGVDTRFVTQ